MFNSCNIGSVSFVLFLKLTPVQYDPCKKRSINVYKTFRPYVALVMQIKYIPLRNTKLRMAASIVYSYQLRYNLL